MSDLESLQDTVKSLQDTASKIRQDTAYYIVTVMERKHPSTCREVYEIVNKEKNSAEKAATFLSYFSSHFAQIYDDSKNGRNAEDEEWGALQREIYKEFMNRGTRWQSKSHA